MKNAYRIFQYILFQRKFSGLTSPFRVLPDFIVIGVGRAATTTLHHNLSKNPCLFSASYDEIGFFDDGKPSIEFKDSNKNNLLNNTPFKHF